MSVDAEDFLVFETYRNAGGHAFSNGTVSDDDKDRYDAIFRHLRDAVAGAIARATAPDELDAWNCRFGRDGGIQGQRPLDLWASIINSDSDAFSRFPQIYVIASEAGVEVGFSVTIHEDDYFNAELKRRNRAIVPIVNSKLPSPDSKVVASIQEVLSAETGWLFGEKTRQGPVSSFSSLPELITRLKTGHWSPKGGGSVYRILDFEEVAETDSRLEDELAHALTLFRPIMQMLQPTSNEAQFARNMVELAEQAEKLPGFDPNDDEDGRRRILREIAVRQGQGRFRDELLQAYNGRCAVTGCAHPQVLQAAHIASYNGTKSNHVCNGLPLRADIHTLFDLGLLRIDPDGRTISLASSLAGSEYEKYHGLTIADPAKPAHRPSSATLRKKLDSFPVD